ncbi:MAG: N-acyl-D-amino-acid deacylase family protein [Gemmatimonadales bacterium]
MASSQPALAAVLLLALACQPPNPAPGSPDSGDGPTFDVVITGGRLVDGAGNPWFYGDVAIRGDRIARITPPGMLAKAKATRRIDATGKVVAPGFIDIQAQSYLAFSVGDGRVISSTTQGITTAILGEGGTPAPNNDATIAAAGPIDSLTRKALDQFRGPRGFNAWLEAMPKHGIAQNVASFLGAGTVRVYAKGELQGPATPAELDTMRAVVKNAMEDGALGIGSALIYPPASYASTDELIEAAKAMAPYGGVYITHMRSEADRLIEGIDEALAIGRQGGVPVEIYHLKASGTKNWPKMAQAIAKIDSARAAGQDVTANMYLYTAGGTALAACAPPWSAEGGKLLANLQATDVRARIKGEMIRPNAANSEALCMLSGPEAVQVVGFRKPEFAKYEGQRLSAIARDMGKDWFEAWADLVIGENGQVGAIFHMMTEANLPAQIRQPWIKWGTDADGMNPDSLQGALTHPRAFGNYPRLLGRYVREQRVISLEEAIRKGTSAVAQRLMIRDRGLLVQGHYADVIVFDPATVIDRATFEQPGQLSTGIEHVFVNGQAVVSDGKATVAKPGRVVRGAGWTGWSR